MRRIFCFTRVILVDIILLMTSTYSTRTMTTITITLENELEQWLKDYSQESGMSPEEAAKGVLAF